MVVVLTRPVSRFQPCALVAWLYFALLSCVLCKYIHTYDTYYSVVVLVTLRIININVVHE